MSALLDTYIIAEVGSNHGGSLDMMRYAIETYATLGADAVKFQWCSFAERMAARRGQGDNVEYVAGIEKYLCWPAHWHQELARVCHENDVDYMCTAYLPEDVKVVAPYVARFKVASFEAGDPGMLEAHVSFGKPVYVSTGMMDGAEVDELWVRAIDASGRIGSPVDLLYCVSSYPAPLDETQRRL
jgi:sialic acid synthase SpsE